MTYVISDIHGRYDLYRRMLEKIRLSPDDRLYVLGDVIDRGPDGIRALLDMMGRDNIFLLAGNHEHTAIGPMEYLARRGIRPAGDGNTLDEARFSAWMECEGAPTIRGFCKLAPHLRREMADYVGHSAIRMEISVGGRKFHLSHTLPDEPMRVSCPTHRFAAPQEEPVFPDGEPLPPGAATEYFNGEPDYRRRYGEGMLFVTGHTPTHLIDEAYFGRIWQGNGHIAMDCAAACGGNLGCLCLDTMEEFYVR